MIKDYVDAVDYFTVNPPPFDAMVDVVMWTKNGAHSLPDTLRHIQQGIPEDCVGKRIIVDDGSVDHTVHIAESFGWQVVSNPSGGISAGANEALRHVQQPYFCSFEQDVLLSPRWWDAVPTLLGGTVAVASGMRFASQPRGVQKLQQYVARKYRGERYLSSWLKSREASSFTLGKTLDNTIYNTAILRGIGGFPRVHTNAGVDTTLAYLLKSKGYEWAVSYDTQSVHLRGGLRDELRHQFWYGTQINAIRATVRARCGMDFPTSKLAVVSRLVNAPLTGLFVALKTREPTVTYIHPLVRIAYARGVLAG